MATFAVDDAAICRVGAWSDTSTALHMTFTGNNTEVWFRIFGDSLKLNYRAGGTAPIWLSVDGGAFAQPSGGPFISTGSTTTLSGELLPGGTSDDWHDIRIRLSNGYSGGGFRLRLADGIVVTSTGGVAAVEAHSDFGEAETIRGTYGLANFHDTYQGALVSTTNFTSPIFPGVTSTMTTKGRNSYVEFYVDANTTKIYVFSVFNNTVGDAIFSMWVDDVRYAPLLLPGTSQTSYGVGGPYTVPGTGVRKVRLTNLRGCHAVIVDGAFVDHVWPTPFRVTWSGDSVTAGDSNTVGFDASGNWDQLIDIRYGGLIECINRGLSGDTANAWNSAASGAGRIADIPSDSDLVIANLSINDATAANSSPATVQGYYETYYGKLLAHCTTATILAIPQLPYASANRTAIVGVIQAAVAAVDDPRLIYVSSDNMVVSVTGDGSHPPDLSRVEACGGGFASINIAAQPSDGNTITINGTVFEFDSNASVSGSNVAVTIGGTLVQTIEALGAAIAANAGSFQLVEYIILTSDTTKQGVAVRGCTSLAKSGTNINVYGPEAVGWLSILQSYLPSLGGTGDGGKRRLLLGVG